MTDRGPARVRLQRRLDWMDTDAARRHHSSVVIRFFEAAEAELHRLGIVGQSFGRIPRVRFEIDLTAQLRFDDLVDVDLAVEEVGRSSLRYRFAVRRDGEQAAAGSVVIVHTDETDTRSEPWPEEWRELFLHAGPQ